MNIFIGILLGISSLIIAGWGLLGIIGRVLSWEDHSEHSSGSSGTLRGWIAVFVGTLFFLIGVGGLAAAFMFLTGRA
jgi:hypothetical protein